MNTDKKEHPSVFIRVHLWFLSVFPSIAIVGTCCALPLLWIVIVIASNPGVFADIQLSSFRLDLLLRTLGYNFSAALIATAMGLPAGLVLGRGRGWLARGMWIIVPAAMFMPSLAFAYGWSQVVRLLGITPFPGGGWDVLRCVWTLGAWLWAVPACVIGLALRRMDTSVQQQAALDGALLRIMLRQLLAPIVVSLAAVTILATQEFSVYEPTGISVVATEVRMVFDTGAFSSMNNPIAGSIPAEGMASPDQRRRAASAVATALPLLVITMALAGFTAWVASRFSTADEIALGSWPRSLDAPWWIFAIAIVLLILNLAAPIASLLIALRVPLSVTRIWDEFSPAVGGSILVGSAAGLLGAFAALSACVCWPRGSLIVAGLAFLVGGQILAISLIRIANRPGLLWAYDSAALPIAAYFGRFGWLALLSARATWTKPWRELRQIAALDGATPLRVAVGVVWPISWPTLAASCILLGAMSLTEVTATVLLSPQNPQVLTPMLMTWVHMARFDPMIEASLLMVGMVLVPVVAATLLVIVARRKPQQRILDRNPA